VLCHSKKLVSFCCTNLEPGRDEGLMKKRILIFNFLVVVWFLDVA
jgi:hypothetical protein